eukprot:CAMPEP_0202695120 /NCGR_PEP_ID=MMETSP1385-20130828/8790_1 /ASSEMBLY_ACC=CAM_ASM_000861 /TAXON_ID=933848 /ORGANISM="Elphidium margaritaceum" /LENGTH=472 /DNA_ID=CAMNT_0049351089 /DNA_START=48 /DNA_END=1466 /DNA_ORIENTATION=-
MADVSPQAHLRRRSSLPNIKFVPLTIAERRVLARQRKKQEEEARKVAAKKAAEEKKLKAKQRRKELKAIDAKSRSKYSLKDGMAQCAYCGEFIQEIEYEDHIVSHPTQIRVRIWLGNAENSKDLKFLRGRGVTHILNATREIELPKDVSKAIKSFKRIAIQDKTSDTVMHYIRESNAFIDKALAESSQHVIFIHCREGRSRSVSFLSAYLMWKEQISFYAALSDIRSKRHIVLPNNKFYAELERYDRELVKDRAKYGAPDASFKLKKVKLNKNKQQNGKEKNVFAMVPKVPKRVSDDAKLVEDGDGDEDDDDDDEEEVDVSQLVNGKYDNHSGKRGKPDRHHRRRSSLPEMDMMMQLTGRAGRVSGITAGRVSGISTAFSRALSPVPGSPVGKKKRQAKAGVSYEKDIKPKNARKKKSSNSSSKSTSRSKEATFDIEEPMDASDIFANVNGTNKSKKKTKSSSKKKNKKAKN